MAHKKSREEQFADEVHKTLRQHGYEPAYGEDGHPNGHFFIGVVPPGPPEGLAHYIKLTADRLANE
jgi:hypothetical protein